MADHDSNYLVNNVTRLQELLQQEGQALPPEGVVERSFRTTPDTISSRTTDTNIGTRTATVEHLVSLGLTWGKLTHAIYQDGRENGVLWMGQDTCLVSCRGPLNGSGIPPDFRQLLIVQTYHRSGTRRPEDPAPPDHFVLRVIGTNPTSDSCVCVMNLVAEIIALDESIETVVLVNYVQTVMHFPTSALERLVSKSRSKRRLIFLFYDSRDRISTEHMRVLFNGSCNSNIELQVDCPTYGDDGVALIEALRSNQCPAILHVMDVRALSEARFVEFTEALCVNESLEEIQFDRFRLHDIPDHKKGMLLRAVAAHRCIQSLSFFGDIALNNVMLWQVFWSLIAQNTSLMRIDFRLIGPGNIPTDDLIKVDRSNCIVEALKRNTTLTDISYVEDEHDPVIMQEVVLPMLELNRYRPRIQAIRKIPNDTIRWGLLGEALLHPQFQQCTSLVFNLLLVNSDGFGALVKPPSEAENSIAWQVKKRRRKVPSRT